jgi:hypothetical protein
MIVAHVGEVITEVEDSDRRDRTRLNDPERTEFRAHHLTFPPSHACRPILLQSM